MDIGKRKNEYKGLKFYDLTYDVPVKTNVTFSINEREKYVMRNVPLSFDRHENSIMYQDEVVISAYSSFAPTIEYRAENKTLARVEIPVPLLTFSQMCAVAQDRIWNYRFNSLPEKIVTNLSDML